MSESIANSQSVKLAEYPYAPQPPLLPFEAVKHGETHPDILHKGRRSVLAIALLIVFGLNNFAVVPLMDATNGPNEFGAVMVFTLIGMIFAQAALISLGFVFAEGPFWRRLVVVLSMTIVFWGVWEIGFVASQLYHGWNSRSYAETIQYTGLVLPLAAIAVQWPLWFFRLYLGWRLTSPTENEAPVRPLAIRDYLIGTAIAAVAVAFARLAPPDTWDTKGYWPGWAAFFGFAGAISLAFVVPATVLMHRIRDWRVGYCLVVSYSIVTGAVFLVTVAIFDKNFRDNIFTTTGFWEALSILAAFATFGVFLGAGLIAARDMGFRLVFGARASSASGATQIHVVDAPRAWSQPNN